MNYFIGDNFSHHAAHSGYMRLVSYIAGEKIFESEKPPLFSTLIKRLFVRRSGMLWYDAQSFVLELTAALKGVEKKHKIFHFLYGEDNYRYLGSIPWMKDNFIVATFHTPPAKFQRGMRYTNHLKNLRAAIIVSNYQRKILESVVSPERIHFIPHGIDTDFFRPAVKTSKICEWEICLCVGHHMRDLPTLCEAARLVSGKRPKVKFILVDSAFFTASFFSLDNAKTEDIRRSYLRQFEEIANFEFKSEIDEASLLDLYQKSDLLTAFSKPWLVGSRLLSRTSAVSATTLMKVVPFWFRRKMRQKWRNAF